MPRPHFQIFKSLHFQIELIMVKLCLAFVLVGLCGISCAQVSNNSIINRLHLEVDASPFNSTTTNASVEWNCINKALTKKCLVYHNDQWFDFSVRESGTYFLNVSAQQCHEKRGVQAIIIEGNPCEVKTYKILKCISQIQQDDVFIKLDSLKPGIFYLVNIDGFLGDFCDFRIQLATKPFGLPLHLEKPGSVLAPVSQHSRLVKLEWSVKRDSIDNFEKFHVYRRKISEIVTTLINEQPVILNTYGAPILHYETSDSLRSEGVYRYQIYGIQKETLVPSLLVVQKVSYYKSPSNLPAQRIISLQLDYPDKMKFQVVVYDRLAYKTLSRSVYEFDSTMHRRFEINVGDFLDAGVKEFMILLSNPNSKQGLEFYYRVGKNGTLVKE